MYMDLFPTFSQNKEMGFINAPFRWAWINYL